MKLAAQLILLAALAVLPAAADTPATAANYRIGETAAEDIVTPVPLTVIDTEATALMDIDAEAAEALRLQELRPIPLIYRFNPRAADETEAAFRKTFAATREKFLTAVEKTFSVRRLSDPTVASSLFQKFAAAFQNANDGFPASLRLLTSWARGESDELLEDTLTSRLRDAMGRYIRPEGLPAGVKPGTRAIVVAASPDTRLTLEAVDRQHDDVARASMPTLGKVSADLMASFPPEDQPAATFLAGFLRENCLFDTGLTRQSRARQTGALLTANNYEAGQLIVRRGQVINSKTKAALDQLHEKLRVGNLQQQVAESRTQNLVFGERTRWLLVTLAAVLLVSGFAIWRITALRRRTTPAASNLPMKIVGAESDGMVIACPTCHEHIAVPFAEADPTTLQDCNHDHGSPEQWKQRALAAERRAEQAAAMVRAGMLTQIAQNLTGNMVRQLIDQRDQLAQTQHQAANAVESLEGRLEKTEAHWQNWRRVYENRIAELEKELAESNEMNRALIRTKIAAAREQMASAEAAHRRTLTLPRFGGKEVSA